MDITNDLVIDIIFFFLKMESNRFYELPFTVLLYVRLGHYVHWYHKTNASSVQYKSYSNYKKYLL